MDIGLTLLYSLYTVLQNFILLSPGMISFARKIYTSDSLKNLSMLLVNLFFPVQGFIEIARMATPENVKVFWIMVLSVGSSMLIGFFVGYFLNWLFKLEVRIKFSYSLLLSIPSLGTLPLVLGRAFCFPGGPLEGDPQCDNMLGYMNINSLIFNLILFIFGFNLIISDKNNAAEIEQKLYYCWPLVCEQLYEGKNYAVLRLFDRYMTKKQAKKLSNYEFENFDKDIRLVNVPGKVYYTLVNASGQSKEYLFYDKKIIEENAEEGEERNTLSNEKGFEQENNINKKVKNMERKLESNHKNHNTNNRKINESHRSSNPSVVDKSYDSRIQKISLGENDIKLSIDETNHQEENKEPNKINIITDENKKLKKKSLFSEDFDLKFDNINKVNSDLNSQLNCIQMVQPHVNVINFNKHKKEKPKSKRYSRLKLESIFEGLKKFVNFHSFKEFKKYFEKLHDKQIKNEDVINLRLPREKPLIVEDTENSQYSPYSPYNPYSPKQLNYDSDIVVSDDNKHLKRNKKLERRKKQFAREYKNFLDYELKVIKKNTFNLDKSPIMIYYAKLFEKIEEFRYKEGEAGFDVNEDNLYHIEKINILIHLHGKEFKDDPELNGKNKQEIYNFCEQKEKSLLDVFFDHNYPPSFPIARGLNLTVEDVRHVNSIWEEYVNILKKAFPDFELNVEKEPTDILLIINKIYSPILLGSILGLVVGISGMREVLFSYNHYISNLVEGIAVISKAAVPFLLISVGVQFLAMRKIDLNVTLSKKHIIVSLIHRYVIVPAIGFLWVYLWMNFYGGVARESKVFRMCIFIPFCLPCSANICMIVNLIGYFQDETSVILLIQNIAMLVGLTILYMIYFVIFES